MKKLNRFAGITLLFILLSGCKNGSEFIDSLNDEIERSQAEYSVVTIKAESNATKSIIPVASVYEKTYKVTDLIELAFEPNPDYTFISWFYEPEDSLKLIESNVDNGIATAVFKIVKTANITIKPECEYAKKLTVNFESDNANISPAVPKKYNAGDTFDLECREESDFYFYRWQVFMADSPETELEDFSEYLEFENEGEGVYSASTQVTVKSTGAEIIISPLLFKRPKVVSSSPVYDSNGSFRDSKIVIMFDQEMDESSIFYSAEEIQQLQDNQYTVLTHSTSNKAYGYVDTEGEIHFKNISIKQFSGNSENFLKYYNAPKFDENNKRVLRISTNRNNLPPSVTDIVVTLSKDFHIYNPTSKCDIPLSSDYSYSYRSGSSLDSLPPYIGKINESVDDIIAKIIPVDEADDENLTYNDEWISVMETTDMSSNDFKLCIPRSNKLWLKCKISDGDSGVMKLEWTASQIDVNFTNGENFSANSSYNPVTRIVDTFPDDATSEIEIDKIIDLSDAFVDYSWCKVFKLVFTVTDYSGNIKRSKNFYFYYDL